MAAGFFAGLLGIGGGVIISPLLIFFLPTKMAAEVSTHAAIATALAVTTITTAASFTTHARAKAVHWRCGIMLALGASAAALIIGTFAWRIPAAALQSFLAVFLLFVGARMLRAKKQQQQPPPQTEPHLPGALLLTTGGIIGALSAVLGIAGGIMTVPFLARRRFMMRRAIGTSAFVGFPLTAAACAGYIVGWQHVFAAQCFVFASASKSAGGRNLAIDARVVGIRCRLWIFFIYCGRGFGATVSSAALLTAKDSSLRKLFGICCAAPKFSRLLLFCKSAGKTGIA